MFYFIGQCIGLAILYFMVRGMWRFAKWVGRSEVAREMKNNFKEGFEQATRPQTSHNNQQEQPNNTVVNIDGKDYLIVGGKAYPIQD